MKLLEFRITNYRSIKDTGWCPFSADGVTVLIGQNESGKSSILSALAKSLNTATLDDDDLRTDADLPSISIRLQVDFEEIEPELNSEDRSKEQMRALEKYIVRVKGKLEYITTWENNSGPDSKGRYRRIRKVSDPVLDTALFDAWLDGANKPVDPAADTDASEIRTLIQINVNDVGYAIYRVAPLSLLFDQESGLLPNRIDIGKDSQGDYVLSGNGGEAAANYLDIAGINLSKLLSKDERAREAMLNRGNEKVTSNFATFWNQTIGKRDKLSLKCHLRFYEQDTSDKTAGSPYLIFWITDGQNHLFPKQRSTGVRWFLSFYLQLKASDDAGDGTLFLLDEPGANLHSRAQSDVLHLINNLRNKQIVYSTHSPHMIEYDKLYRVLAVQRAGDDEDTPTTVIHAHRLGGASRDTLSPILTAMGADLSQQEVIKKSRNVILEEMSGFYYLTAFWKLLRSKTEAYFIAATGVSNVELLANMFLGWGLGFAVVVDDDQAGRAAYNSIRRHMFADNDELSRAKMLKIEGKGIEDTFSQEDFRSFVLREPDAKYKLENSQYVKDTQQSKVLLAYQFMLSVEREEITFGALSADTQAKIKKLEQEIASRL